MDIDEVISQHKDLVYHVINRIVFDASYHQDLFQEAFLRIAKNLPTFQGRSKLSTWIYSVTAHTCLNHLRKLKSDRSYSMEEWLEEAGEGALGLSNEETVCVDSSTKERLDGAINQLPPKYRMPVVLFYMEHLSYREIAECLAMPIGTVKTNLYRGLRKLRDILGGDIHDHL